MRLDLNDANQHMNPFIKTFSTYSNLELFRIIQTPENYQDLAVEAAQIITNERNLSEEDVEIANAQFAKEKEDSELKKTKKEAFETNAKDVVNSVIDVIHPIQRTPITTDRIIKTFCVVFGIAFFVFFYKEFWLIKFMFTDKTAKWDIITVLYFLAFIIIPTATILFFNHKKIGWMLFAIFLTYNSLTAIYDLYTMIKIQQSRFSTPFGLFPKTLPVGTILFFVGSMLVICKTNIRKVYGVSAKSMLITIGIIAEITSFFIFG